MRYSITLSILFISISFFSQKKIKLSSIAYSSVNPVQLQDIWEIILQSKEMPSPDGNSEKDRLLRLKNKLALIYPRKNTGIKSIISNDSILQNLIIEEGFDGNPYNNRVPNDNTLAISKDGILILGINSRYLFYDTNDDSFIGAGSLHLFTTGFPQFNTVSKYDPKFIYDPNEDRFIITFLIGTSHQNSNICVAFSSTNDPSDDWNVYLLSGDPLETEHWTDYPAISLSEDELFITGNLLANGVSWQLGFQQSLIWQIDKFDGYNGETDLDFQVWSDIKDDTVSVRNIHPARGARALRGPNQFLLSNKNFSAESDTVYLIEITNTLNSGNAQLNLTKLSLEEHYFLSPNGKQSIAKELSTNDSRMLGAIVDDNWIQYVHHSMDTTYGTSGIFHGIIENYSTEPVISGKIISDSIMDYGYPNIASTGINPNEKECVIGFNYTSPVDTNGVACCYMDNSSNYSDRIMLKSGDAPINSFVSGSIDRWGDYFGIQRMYSEPCKVWMSGMYGKISSNASWVSKVAVSDTCRNPDPIVSFDPPYNNGILFPNPAVDWMIYDFSVDEIQMVSIGLFDIKGKLVKVLFEDQISAGENRLTFNTFFLEKGMYILRVTSESKILSSKKFVKAY